MQNNTKDSIEILELFAIIVLLFFILIHYVTLDHQINFINSFMYSDSRKLHNFVY